MRITFLLMDPRVLDGGLRVIAQYAASLARNGHQVTMLGRERAYFPRLRTRIKNALLRRTPSPARFPAENHFSARELHPIVFPAGSSPGPADLPDADVVIATWWETAELLPDLPPEKGAHVHFIQDHEVFHNMPRDRVEAVYRQPTHKIVVASWLARAMRENYGQSSHLVVNGVETATFHAPGRTRSRPPCIGFLHSTARRKNVGLAVDAMEAARRARPDLRCIAFGSHDAPDLPDWIDYEMRPAQTRIAELYAACDAWLFPSTSEGFGLPLLEAMACGTPVLAARAGAAEDLVTPGNGRLLERTTESFSDAILEIAGLSDADWTEMSQAARRTAEAHDLSPASERFEAVLTRIASDAAR